MIYTSYFANLKKIPNYIVPIAICAKSPDWYTGLQYKKLAPKWSFFSVWRETHDNDYYIENFNKLVLDELNVHLVVEELLKLSKNKNICLLCYEKPDEFCHRHLVSDWLKKHGYFCEELDV